jgi:hypothetical protein
MGQRSNCIGGLFGGASGIRDAFGGGTAFLRIGDFRLSVADDELDVTAADSDSTLSFASDCAP